MTVDVPGDTPPLKEGGEYGVVHSTAVRLEDYNGIDRECDGNEREVGGKVIDGGLRNTADEDGKSGRDDDNGRGDQDDAWIRRRYRRDMNGAKTDKGIDAIYNSK